ncbi:MAG: sodium:proton exchanger [Nocardioidaceae bacterium]
MTQTDTAQRARPYPLIAALAVAVPGAYLGLAAYLGLPAVDLGHPVEAAIFGAAIVGAAFALSWAAEAAQVDINAGLALALLALLAVLPEYAVDFVFTVDCGNAYSSGSEDATEVCSLALANMTGANRVLVGIGWPLVVLVATFAVWRNRRSGAEDPGTSTTQIGEVKLRPALSVEVVFLGIATLYSLTLPLRSSITLVDAVVFVGIFAAYAWRLARMEPSEPSLMGVSAWVGGLETRQRRSMVTAMFVVAAAIILLAAEHFADSLVGTGRDLGVDEFLLVQWVAPLASEAPELIVACLYAWRLKAEDSLGTLLSSKVNQWTLLVGGLPIVFSLTALTTAGLPIDTHQRYELLITAAQSFFAVAILLDRKLTYKGALMLLALFVPQLLVSVLASERTNQLTILAISALYGVLAITELVRRRRRIVTVIKDGTVTPPKELADQPA